MNKKPVKLKIHLMIFLMILVIVLTYNFKIFSTHNEIYYSDANAETELFNITNNKFEQHFYADEAVRQIEIVLYPAEGQSGQQITIQAQLFAAKNDHMIAADTQTIEQFNQAKKIVFNFPNTESSALTEYYLVLKTQGKQDVYAKSNLNEYKEKLLYGGELINQRLIFKVIYSNNFLWGFFLLTLMLFLLSLSVLFFPNTFKFRPETLFVLFALLSGLAMTFTVPTGQEPDTGDHILRAFDVSYGNLTPLFGKANDISIQMPDNFPIFDDTVMNPNQNLGLSRLSNMLNDQFTAEIGQNYDYRYKAQYSIPTYYPQGLGLYIGRLMSLNEYYMLAMARVFNLVFYILLTYLSIRIIPIYKNLLMFLALMPISIYQASSLSADATINGLLFVFIALVVRLAETNKKINLLHLILPMLFLYFVVMAKLAYIGMILFLLYIPLKNYQKLSRKIIHVGMFLVPTFLVGVFAAGFSTGKLILAEQAPEYATQMQFVLHNLVPTFNIFMHTISQYGSMYISWLNYLGWLTYPLGILIYVIPITLIFVGLKDEKSLQKPDLLQKIATIGTIILSIAGIFIGLYIYDDVNAIGANLMLGVQGRYFIPIFLIPFLLFGQKSNESKRANFPQQIAGISGIFLTYSMLILIEMIY